LHFTASNPDVRKENRSIWFREWIVGKQTFEQLHIKSGYSERTLKCYFYDYLSHSPRWNITRRDKVNLLIDGTYFTNKICLVLYRENNIKATLFYRLTDGEWFDEILEDIENLLKLGIIIESVTCDGLRNISKASPSTTIQHYFVHIQRETLNWLSDNRQNKAGFELRNIIRRFHLIQDKTFWSYWIV
jgi:hypothetical protein